MKIKNLKRNLLNNLKITIFSKLAFTGLIAASISSCSTEQIDQDELDPQNESYASQSISIINFDFEDGKEGWSDEEEIAISSIVSKDEGFLYGGKKSIKISSSGDRVTQLVKVFPNTSYLLSAIINGEGYIGAGSGKTNYIDTNEEWKQVSYTFNSGSATSITIFGEAQKKDTRFDNFSLTTISTDNPENEENSDNLAYNKETNQSSTGYGGVSSRAVDGNTNGVWRKSSITHTNREYRPWWQVRLGKEYAIGEIKIWNRTDNCCVSRLANFDIFIYNDAGKLAYKTTIVETPTSSVTINAEGAIGSRVRVKLKDTNPLSLAEVQVFEYSGSTDDPEDEDEDEELITDKEDEDDKENEEITDPPLGDAKLPSDLMNNCKQWKITYPTGEEDKTLCDESNNEFFFVNEDKNGLVFRAPIRSDNGTTKNSSYIRSELRERTQDGKSDIYWTTDGKHVIYVAQAITHLPKVKSHLVATQIHGNKSDGIDDSMVLRLEEEHLFLSFNGGKLRSNLTIKNDYKLGQPHEVIFEVIDGKHYCYYSEDGNLKKAYESGNASQYLVKDGSSTVLMDLNYDQTYFKIGNYTQSNPDKEGSATNDADNYGEVVVYDFFVNHQ